MYARPFSPLSRDDDAPFALRFAYPWWLMGWCGGEDKKGLAGEGGGLCFVYFF